MLSLQHTIYTLEKCLRSLKLTYTSTPEKLLLYLTNKQQETRKFNSIHLILNSKKSSQIDSKIEYILTNYAFPLNKSINNAPIFSKYLQSYLYTSKQQKNLCLKIYINEKTNKAYSLNIINLNIIYIIYRLMKSKHPIYIYNQVYKNL